MTIDASSLNLVLSTVLVVLASATAYLAARAQLPWSMVLAGGASALMAITLVVSALGGVAFRPDAPLAEAALILRFMAVILFTASLWQYAGYRFKHRA